MNAKIFINLNRATWEAIEPGYKTGDVLDYPIAEIPDILNGTVGDPEHQLYAVTGDRVCEITQFKFPATDDYYCLADDGKNDCIDIWAAGHDEETACTDLGALLDAAYEAFQTGKYLQVTMFCPVGLNDFHDFYAFEK